MSGLGKGVLGVVGISRNEGGAGTFPDKGGGHMKVAARIRLGYCQSGHK